MYCDNNEYEASPSKNGGTKRFGTATECLQKGYAKRYNQSIENTESFLRKWTRGYKPHIKQTLYCGSELTLPRGYDLQATLPQCLQKGYALGSIARARKVKRRRYNEDENPSTIFSNR